MSNYEICRLCSLTDEHLIDILKDNGQEMVTMIEMFLCVTIKFEDEFHCICIRCKTKILDWNLYYTEVQNGQEKFLITQLSIKEENVSMSSLEGKENHQMDSNIAKHIIPDINIKHEPPEEISYSEINTSENGYAEPYMELEDRPQQMVFEVKELCDPQSNFTQDMNIYENSRCDESIQISDETNKEPETNKNERIVIIQSSNGRKRKPKTTNIPRKDSTKDKMINRYYGFNCSECDVMFLTWIECKNHMNETHQMHSMKFACCNIKLFLRRSSLLGHLWYHLDPDKLKCDQCAQQFQSIEDKQACEKAHQLEFEESKKIQCSKCDAKIDPRFIMSHMKHHVQVEEQVKDMVQCDMCKEFFKSKLSILSHMRQVHNIYPTCEKCGECFSSRKLLESHLEKHKLKKKVKCPDCGVVIQRNRLTSHKREVHREEECMCDICAKTFKNKHRLTAHLRLHRESNCECEICGKKFNNNYRLKEHKSRHFTFDRFGCDLCEFINNDYCNMLKHRKLKHKDVTPLEPGTAKEIFMSRVNQDNLVFEH